VVIPSGNVLTGELFDTLPDEWANGDNGEWWIESMRFDQFPEQKVIRDQVAMIAEMTEELEGVRTVNQELMRHLENRSGEIDGHAATIANLRAQVENLQEKNGNQQTMINDMQGRLDDQRHEIAGLEVALGNAQQVKSVGITDDEYEKVRSRIIDVLNQIGQARIEDADGVLDNAADDITEALDLLPKLEERDLGWGDDDQLQVLEDVQHDIARAATFMKDTLDNIRTER